MTDLDLVRRFFAEEIRVACNIRLPGLADALAEVPRERFLPPGPWLVRGMYDAESRQTDDASPQQVCHDVVVAIDPARNLYNGQPSLIARWLEMLSIRPGERVLHIGCATGYYTALIARLVGPTGRVFAVDVDESLAERARTNLAEWPWVTVSAGDGRTALPANVDVVLVHAGATHVLDEWLDAACDGGRLLVPLTGTIPGMLAGIGKGVVLKAERHGDTWSARVGSMVAIYSLIGLRDAAQEANLGPFLMGGKWAAVTRLRRDAHEPAATCLLHGPTNCLSS